MLTEHSEHGEHSMVRVTGYPYKYYNLTKSVPGPLQLFLNLVKALLQAFTHIHEKGGRTCFCVMWIFARSPYMCIDVDEINASCVHLFNTFIQHILKHSSIQYQFNIMRYGLSAVTNLFYNCGFICIPDMDYFSAHIKLSLAFRVQFSKSKSFLHPVALIFNYDKSEPKFKSKF